MGFLFKKLTIGILDMLFVILFLFFFFFGLQYVLMTYVMCESFITIFVTWSFEGL